MKSNLHRLKRAAAGVATLAAAATMTMVASGGGVVHALAPGAPASGTLNIVGTGLNSGSTFGLSFNQASSYCNGDGVAGYRWHTFIVPIATDPALVSFPAGSVAAPSGYVQALRGTDGHQYLGESPTTVDTNQGFINLPTNLTFSSPAYGTPAGSPGNGGGEFWLGVACTSDTTGTSVEYWTTTMTATPQVGAGPRNFVFAQGTTAAAPHLDTVGSADGTLTANFTPGTSNPAATSFTATATDGTNTFTQSGPASPLTIGGLQNGTAYTVTVTADNGVHVSVPSNSLPGTPNAAARPAPLLTATSGVDAVDLSWTVPTGEAPAVRNGYLLTSTGTLNPTPWPAACVPFTATTCTLPASTQSLHIPAANGSYTFTVKALYNGTYVGAVSTPASASSNAAGLLIQGVTTTRPAGALVVTQRCGVHGDLPVYDGTAQGFGTLPLAPGFANGADNPAANLPQGGPAFGTPPTISGTPDSLFPEYPYPAALASGSFITDSAGNHVISHQTTCGLALGTAKLITTGDNAGKYFAANGYLNQITVVNTNDVDAGWNFNGRMDDFVNAIDSTTFSGNLLGWAPKKTYDSTVNMDHYDMTVLPGARVDPQASSSSAGLASNRSLATSAPFADNGAADDTGSLGLSLLDARMVLLIPVTANSGNYTGNLTFTFI